MNKQDFYKTLGIEKGASAEEIKKAYRTLAHKYHPDKAGGNETKFKEINEAYQILSDPQKRAQYDQFGQTFGQGQNRGEWGGQSPFGFEFDFGNANMGDFSNLGDIFDSFFEGMGVKRKRKTYRRGSDLEMIQEITLEEAFRGTIKPLHYKTHISCSNCGGVGHFPKDGFTECVTCNGRGEIKEVRNTFFGGFEQVRPCEKCRGTGQIPKKSCATCSGGGRVKGEKTVEVSIAAGIMNDQLIKIPRAGEVGEHTAESGDLYIRVKVKPHSRFERNGDDLLTRENIKLIDILLGKKITISTISGESVALEIPRGFRLGDNVVVANGGMPRLGAFGKGKLVVELNIKIPEKLTPKAKKLLEDLKVELE